MWGPALDEDVEDVALLTPNIQTERRPSTENLVGMSECVCVCVCKTPDLKKGRPLWLGHGFLGQRDLKRGN